MGQDEDKKRKFSQSHLGKKQSEETKKKRILSGERHYRWKGGITPLRNIIRKCFKYRQWRSDVFTRDDFTCTLCGTKGKKLCADHYPKSFSNIFDENNTKTLEQALDCEEFWNINNGRTLCEDCHKKTENYLKHTKKT